MKKELLKSEDISKEQLEFTVFCIENLADRLGINGDEAYELLTKQSQVLKEYILPYYDVLHTQSKEYILDDILDYMRTLGVVQ